MLAYPNKQAQIKESKANKQEGAKGLEASTAIKSRR
jgi:hypothetical protein